MAAAYDHEDVPHTLLPLVLAVGLVRHKVYDDQPLTNEGREGDLGVLANFMAQTIPIYEYSLDASRPPRPVGKHELVGGMFRDGARELRFIDGRPPLRQMAVNATDVECVLSLLREPERAVQIHAHFVRRRAQKIRARSALLRKEAKALRHHAQRLCGAEAQETRISRAA